MRNNVLIIKFLAIACITILLTGIIPINFVYAAKNGDTIIKRNTSNNILIIGDSRMYQLYERKKTASYACVWGGHYYGNVKETIPSINRNENKEKIKNMIKKIVKEKGSCRVIIEATINDYNGQGSYIAQVNNLIKFAEEVANYNKKAVVYVASLIPARNGKSVNNFNKKLKEEAKKRNRIRFLDIKPNKVKYESDGLHFTKETSNDIYKIIKSKTKSK